MLEHTLVSTGQVSDTAIYIGTNHGGCVGMNIERSSVYPGTVYDAHFSGVRSHVLLE